MRLFHAQQHRQKGVALLVVLAIFALAASLATAILYRQSHFRERTANLLDWDQRFQYALSVEAVAIQGLQMDLDQDSKNNQLVDSCAHEQWAVSLPPTPYKGAVVSASVQDLQARFNLNWVVKSGKGGFVQDETGIKMLQHLLEQLLANPGKAKRLAYEMADWSDSNNLVDGVTGAEDGGYKLARTPNLPIADETELRALRDMTQKDIGDKNFWQYFAALPIPSTLNVNDAAPKVLKAVLGSLVGKDAVETIVKMRQKGPITSIDELMDHAPFKTMNDDASKLLRKYIGVNSQYFQVMTDVETNGHYLRLVSRLQRPQKGATAVYNREIIPRLKPLEPACNPVYNKDDSANDNTIATDI